MRLPDTRAAIALLLITAFLVAYFLRPTDVMSGALLAAFAAAWGYYLGSSKGASENRDALNRMSDKLSEPGA